MAVVVLCGLLLLLAIGVSWPPTVVTVREEPPTPRTIYLVITATPAVREAGPPTTRTATPTMTPLPERLPTTPQPTRTATPTAEPSVTPVPPATRPAVQRG